LLQSCLNNSSKTLLGPMYNQKTMRETTCVQPPSQAKGLHYDLGNLRLVAIMCATKHLLTHTWSKWSGVLPILHSQSLSTCEWPCKSTPSCTQLASSSVNISEMLAFWSPSSSLGLRFCSMSSLPLLFSNICLEVSCCSFSLDHVLGSFSSLVTICLACSCSYSWDKISWRHSWSTRLHTVCIDGH